MTPCVRELCLLSCAGLLPDQFVYLLNNGPETDTSIYDGANNGVGLTPHTAQVRPIVLGAGGTLAGGYLQN
jgi:hypothetical protein